MDFIIIGGGIFGLAAAIELRKRGYSVRLFNRDDIPDPLAASTDISKAVRMEYGSDQLYFEMARLSIEGWHEWNDLFGTEVYKECGFLMLGKEDLSSERQAYERESIKQLGDAGFQTKVLDSAALSKFFPAVNNQKHPHAHFNSRAGYVESGKCLSLLKDYAIALGVIVVEKEVIKELLIESYRITGVRSANGKTYNGDQLVVCAGAYSSILVPELKDQLIPTGHPVFWLECKNPDVFSPPNFSVFTADISNTGWYGFPYNKEHGIVKVAKHSMGIKINPEFDERRVTEEEIKEMREFIKNSFPSLSNAKLVYTRKCLYTDTRDGHFWIDRHPKISGLYVSSGGSGHAMKMGPILGALTADCIEQKENKFLDRFKWRKLSSGIKQEEEARNV